LRLTTDEITAIKETIAQEVKKQHQMLNYKAFRNYLDAG